MSKTFLVFGGGGKVARHFARLAVMEGHEVVSVVRNDDHSADLKALGAQPAIASLEEITVPSLTSLLTQHSPDSVVFSAGAGGKGPQSRTRAVDYEGAVKVFDAMENANVKRLLYVGASDVRDTTKEAPEWYTEESKSKSDSAWKSMPDYMKAKYDAELELHSRKALEYTVLRPGWLTLEPAGGVELGKTQIGNTSRELVAQVLLACAQEPGTAGLTFDVLDGQGTIQDELNKVVQGKIDAWTG
ncbi:hypothetical protein BCR39DRAFT_565604 [Naematelia encephala]|uniref:NAD(P)-binding domain-containing protein n=1 Tax=Naematelia encephala TaxID=71784 RepID=A0A1Y2AZU0_9TREE|nr:hypothetical protein BCR39DRAFT_565604 [Naematelia encephala]